jgi:hypothetical protein
MMIKTKVYVREFCFLGQCAIECMVGFRIESHTIKRELKIANMVI